jgi:hypothetical protein
MYERGQYKQSCWWLFLQRPTIKDSEEIQRITNIYNIGLPGCVGSIDWVTQYSFEARWLDGQMDVEMDEEEIHHISNFHLRENSVLRHDGLDRTHVGVHFFNCNTGVAFASHNVANT